VNPQHYFKIYRPCLLPLLILGNLRDRFSGILDVYLFFQSAQLNEVMKVLTIIATIFMPLTFLAGVITA